MEEHHKAKIPRIAVFIDASNLWSSYKSMGKMLELKKLDSFLAKKFSGNVSKIFYYVAYPKEGTREKEKIIKFHNFLVFLEKGLGFNVVKKPLKTILLLNKDGKVVVDENTEEPQTIEKGNLDVEMAMDVMRFSNTFEIGIFFTGDSDFLPVITHLRNLKPSKEVYVFSTEDCVSKELKTGANGYFDLANCTEIHQCKLLSKEERKNSPHSKV